MIANDQLQQVYNALKVPTRRTVVLSTQQRYRACHPPARRVNNIISGRQLNRPYGWTNPMPQLVYWIIIPTW